MEASAQEIPVRVYQSDDRITLTAPMPGLAPEDIHISIQNSVIHVRGEDHSPGQHSLDFIMNEWSVGPYERELTLPVSVRGDLANATYGNGVLVLSLPKAEPGEETGASFNLRPISPTRGERVGHSGKEMRLARPRARQKRRAT
ncbi:MAG TPA: Hsp20/alpha crystallin family protein [Candidatus Eisenbacteria bacterium]|nr:Hsp20/alpha crystallin family protein [Candidatus Eisenbacteria bacterium]